jgi:pimeloyl-ACP methyl ester carboxylesterase
MKKRWIVLTFILASFSIFPMAFAENCENGTQWGGARYRICLPEGSWNRDLVIYAHGYVSPFDPIAIPEDQLVLPDGTSIPGIINQLGFAFATTSYSKNGLAVLPGIADVVDLAEIFREKYPETRRIYLVGVSEGALITTLAVERYPQSFSGGFALCGPVGDFRRQINYWGDFRVVFDYFFPGVIPGSPVAIPAVVIDNWETSTAPAVLAAIHSRPHATQQLLRVTKAPTDPLDPATIDETVLGLLWYNVFATNDGVATLGGHPFDNQTRIYWGSDNDLLLNWRIKRFRADASALAEISAHYQTSGRLKIPLVTMHTTGDPIVPYWHETLYLGKVLAGNSGLLHTNIPIFRYGHCNFKASEALAGFALLVLKASGMELLEVLNLLPDFETREEFLSLWEKHLR